MAADRTTEATRAAIADSSRIVVKVGSSSLTTAAGGIELPGITAVERPLQRSHVRELILRKSDYVSRVQNHANLLTGF